MDQKTRQKIKDAILDRCEGIEHVEFNINDLDDIVDNIERVVQDDSTIRHALRAALENMYMFGGMPKPDPGYERYINNMIESVMGRVTAKPRG